MGILASFKQRETVILICLFVLLLTTRFLILKDFGFQFAGHDDQIFWQAANDYAKGIFQEPYFYGQNYNYALEALFAAPLNKWEYRHITTVS